ncbi:polysaccharide biosynthesis C-terminal domain-containing protein [Falsigemmobacter faecalis]|uniref:SDR family oxidoreductase n=1 Tax=Falsigemmobacter faecalis TaxID=2488730 RepID=A0A3P3DH24_9RHOB|nr:NAD-dependent epimerase/dehydratase family protein [Falsigemmobacter faecalis]RRH72976.1 SDR family oxidoreductase [Falsigemmobacter faecalis]
MSGRSVRRILITGAAGFIGRNLSLRLSEIEGIGVIPFLRSNSPSDLPGLLAMSDAVVHLAGENRPADPAAFAQVNAGLTRSLCDAVAATGRAIPLVLASSTRAEDDSPYGRSKRAAEVAVAALAERTLCPVSIFRLPGVFGKGSRPAYNSVVASFCHNIARGLPIRIDDPQRVVRLVYIDNVIDAILAALQNRQPGLAWPEVQPVCNLTLGALADQITAIFDSRKTLITPRCGAGFLRALQATCLSFLPPQAFSCRLSAHEDPRGRFVEMLKTPDSGQFSYFTAHPGVTRGGHYHHTKSEKFLVVEGEALFRFRNVFTGEEAQLRSTGLEPRIVETVPGWAHDVTNIGTGPLIALLWASEIFNPDRPDTISARLSA